MLGGWLRCCQSLTQCALQGGRGSRQMDAGVARQLFTRQAPLINHLHQFTRPLAFLHHIQLSPTIDLGFCQPMQHTLFSVERPC